MCLIRNTRVLERVKSRPAVKHEMANEDRHGAWNQSSHVGRKKAEGGRRCQIKNTAPHVHESRQNQKHLSTITDAPKQ